MGGRNRDSPSRDDIATEAGPVEGQSTRVVLHLTPEAVAEGFVSLDEPVRVAERFPELVDRYGEGEPGELAELRELSLRAAVVPLLATCPMDPAVVRYLRELNAGTYQGGYRPPDLTAYLSLEFATAEEARRFVELAIVEGGRSARLPRAIDDAYLEPIAAESTDGPPPTLPPPTCSRDVRDQLYLGPAPIGMDVDAVRAFPCSDGEGVRLYDLEAGWGPTHAAVPPPALASIGGATASAVHHLKVMGLICTGHGMRPVAPAVAYGHASHACANGVVNDAVACATALSRLRPGDVLLNEYSVTHASTNTLDAPAECASAVYHLIKAATHRIDPSTRASLGIHVVTAGGNGKWRMDRDTGRFSMPGTSGVLPRTVLLGDSGAIVVGAADALLPHRRWATSNHGTRIDCYAWGEKLMTATKAHMGGVTRDAFTCEFGQTSGAAALIGGAVAALQGIAHAAGRGPIDPLRLRGWLGDHDLGTPVYAHHAASIPRGTYPAGARSRVATTAPIGSMPDLGRVAARLLGG